MSSASCYSRGYFAAFRDALVGFRKNPKRFWPSKVIRLLTGWSNVSEFTPLSGNASSNVVSSSSNLSCYSRNSCDFYTSLAVLLINYANCYFC